MKFLLFADFHHYPHVFICGTHEHLHEMQRRAEAEGCDFIIHAGDYTHGPSEFPDIVKEYNDFHIPSYHILGNHDSDRTPLSETLQLYNMPAGYYYFDCKGYRIIVCDPNYYRDGEEFVHYELKNYFAHGPERDWMPPEQLAWLEKTVDEAPGRCILISHESFERANGVKNREEVQRILRDANAKTPGKVILCINGHHHTDFIRILDNICYFDVNSTCYHYLRKPHECYPPELVAEKRGVNQTLAYTDPLYAVVTVEGSSITIKGTTSSTYMGLTAADTGNDSYDGCGRCIDATCQSAHIELL